MAKRYLEIYKGKNEYYTHEIDVDKKTKDTYNQVYGNNVRIYDNKKKLINTYVNDSDKKDVSNFIKNRVNLFYEKENKAKKNPIYASRFNQDLYKLRDENDSLLKYNIQKIRNEEYSKN